MINTSLPTTYQLQEQRFLQQVMRGYTHQISDMNNTSVHCYVYFLQLCITRSIKAQMLPEADSLKFIVFSECFKQIAEMRPGLG